MTDQFGASGIVTKSVDKVAFISAFPFSIPYSTLIVGENTIPLNQEGKTGVHNPESGVPDAEWARQRHAFWKDYLKQCMAVKG